MRSLSVNFLFAVLLCAIALVPAEAHATAAARKPAPPPDRRKLIKSVNAAESTVVIAYAGKKLDHAYKIDDVTVLRLNGVAGKIGDIKPGMEVYDFVERDNDALDSLTLTGHGNVPKPAAKPKAATKPKPKPTPAPAT